MFQKILVANRGEIALRVICACKELGISTVAVYSEADRNSLARAICGRSGVHRAAAQQRKLPEYSARHQRRRNHQRGRHPSRLRISFRERQLREGLRSLGNHLYRAAPEIIEMMGEKDRARREMKHAGLPTIPGSDGAIEGEEQLAKEAAKIGYPLILKASAGGGGRGMRVVRKQEELLSAYETARSEAQQAFGTPDVYAEKFIEHPRHIEFQVLGDQHGKVIHLGERECCIQRRHQKLIEESPSPVTGSESTQRNGRKSGQSACKR